MIRFRKRPRQQPLALRRSFLLLGDFFFHFARIGRKLLVRSLQQPIVETANMLNRTQTVGRHAELVALLKRVRQQRNILQIWQDVRFVLLLAWLTLLPTRRPLPVSSQMRAMIYVLYKISVCGITDPRKSLPLTLHAEKVKPMCGQKRESALAKCHVPTQSPRNDERSP